MKPFALLSIALLMNGCAGHLSAARVNYNPKPEPPNYACITLPDGTPRCGVSVPCDHGEDTCVGNPQQY